MKIAICYKGLLRTIEKTFSNHDEFLYQNNDVDIFCHTWDNNESAFNFLNKQERVKFIFKEPFKNFKSHIYDSLIYKKTINLEEHDNEKKYKELSQNITLHSQPFNILSHLYSIQQVYFLQQLYSQTHSKKYDLICIVRPDIFFYNKINYSEIKEDEINISWYEHGKLDYVNFIIDHIAISNNDIMKLYSECFLNIPSLYLKQNVPLVPEILLGTNLFNNRLNVNMLNTLHTVRRECD